MRMTLPISNNRHQESCDTVLSVPSNALSHWVLALSQSNYYSSCSFVHRTHLIYPIYAISWLLPNTDSLCSNVSILFNASEPQKARARMMCRFLQACRDGSRRSTALTVRRFRFTLLELVASVGIGIRRLRKHFKVSTSSDMAHCRHLQAVRELCFSVSFSQDNDALLEWRCSLANLG